MEINTNEPVQNETESSPYEQICPRHGARVQRYHGCPKCVIEEVHRHEKRIHAPFEAEVPIPTDPIDGTDALLTDIL